MSLVGPDRLIVGRSLVAKEDARCIDCQQPFKFGAGGNVFTREGMAETRISGMCEVCFDRLFDDDGEPA